MSCSLAGEGTPGLDFAVAGLGDLGIIHHKGTPGRRGRGRQRQQRDDGSGNNCKQTAAVASKLQKSHIYPRCKAPRPRKDDLCSTSK